MNKEGEIRNIYPYTEIIDSGSFKRLQRFFLIYYTGSASAQTSGWTPALHSVSCARASTPPTQACILQAHEGPAPPDRSQGLLAPSPLLTRIVTCATPDLLLRNIQMKHLQHMSETDETLSTYV
jgi:hypothetical protein